MKTEEALKLLGTKKKYYIVIFTLLALNFSLTPVHIFVDLFLRYEPSHHCKLPPNGTIDQWIPYNIKYGNYYSCKLYISPHTNMSAEWKTGMAEKIPVTDVPGGRSDNIIPGTTVSRGTSNTKATEVAARHRREAGQEGISAYTDYGGCEYGIVYDDVAGSTMVTDWSLSCDEDVSIISNSVIAVSMVLGALIFSPFVDKYGRKSLFIICWSQNVMLSLGISLIGDIRSYWVLRFLSRLYVEGVEIAIFILAVELVSGDLRSMVPFVLYTAYALGQVLLAFQAYLIQSWRHLQLICTLEVLLLLLPTTIMVPESVSWLASCGKTEEAEKIIRSAAKQNNVPLPKDFHLEGSGEQKTDSKGTGGGVDGKGAILNLQRQSTMGQIDRRKPSTTGEYMQHEIHAQFATFKEIISILNNGHLRRHFFIISYIWAVVGFLYYGMTVSIMSMKGNVFLNYGLSGLVMVPSSISIFVTRRFGRKKPVMYMLLTTGLFVSVIAFVPYKAGGIDLYPLHLTLKLIIKYCVSSCLISVKLIIVELFPTPVRGSLVGLTAIFGLLGSGLGYYYTNLIQFSKYVTVGVGGLTLLAFFLCKRLPETSHRPLPDNIKDVMETYRAVCFNIASHLAKVPQEGETIELKSDSKNNSNGEE